MDFEIDKVAVVVAYGNGRVANYHQLKASDCDRFWSIWRTKVEQYWIKTLSDSPADPCVIAHFDDLLAAAEEKKVYRLAGSKGKPKLTSDSFGDSSKDPSDQANKTLKTKDELINLIKKRSKE